MILPSPEQIREYTERGLWGDKTIIDYFGEHVREAPDRFCLVDPLNRQDLTGAPRKG